MFSWILSRNQCVETETIIEAKLRKSFLSSYLAWSEVLCKTKYFLVDVEFSRSCTVRQSVPRNQRRHFFIYSFSPGALQTSEALPCLQVIPTRPWCESVCSEHAHLSWENWELVLQESASDANRHFLLNVPLLYPCKWGAGVNEAFLRPRKDRTG